MLAKYLSISLTSIISASTLCYADLGVHDTTINASGGTDWSNPVFDVYFLGDNEGAYLQSINDNNLKKLYEEKNKYDPYNYTLDGKQINVKDAVMSGINRWTDTITNRLANDQQKIRIAVNFGTDDKLIKGSDGVAQFGTCEWGKTYSFPKKNGYNKQTSIEAYLRDGRRTFNSSNESNLSVVADSGCVDVVLSFNLPLILTRANTSGKDFTKLISATVTHELGHAMGVSTDLYATVTNTGKQDDAGNDIYAAGSITEKSNMTKFDTLLCLKDRDGNLIRVATLDTTTGKVVPNAIKEFNGEEVDLASGDSLSNLGNGTLVIAKDGAKNGDPTLPVLSTIGDLGYIQGSSYEHLFILDQEGYQHDIMGNYSSQLEFSENDRMLIDMLGYTLAPIPEPSIFGLLAGTLALSVAGTRRRRK